MNSESAISKLEAQPLASGYQVVANYRGTDVRRVVASCTPKKLLASYAVHGRSMRQLLCQYLDLLTPLAKEDPQAQKLVNDILAVINEEQ